MEIGWLPSVEILQLLTIQEMSSQLKVSVKTIYYWVHRWEIPYLTVG